MSPSTSLPYADRIRRLNLTAIGPVISDSLLVGLERCAHVERLTITDAEHVSSAALVTLLRGMGEVPSVDLSSSPGVDYDVLAVISERQTRLHGLNISDCKGLGDSGLSLLASSHPRKLRRVSLHSHSTKSGY